MSAVTLIDRATQDPPAPPANPAARAKLHLQSQSYSALHRISCEHRDGVLVLRGSVPSFHLKQLAQSLVLSLNSIGPLANLIEVRPANCGREA